MKIEHVPTSDLRRIITATERAVGPDAAEVRAMRRELARRDSAKLAGVDTSLQQAGKGASDAR